MKACRSIIKDAVKLALAFSGLLVGVASAEEKISLTDLKPVQIKVGWGQYFTFKDGNCAEHGQPPLICPVGDTSAQTGLYAHAPSEITFDIPKNTHRFEAIGATRSNLPLVTPANGGLRILGSWAYEVLIDGNKVYESEPFMAYERRQIPIQVVIPKGSKRITLKINELGHNACDWSYWAEPYFIRP